MNIFKWLFNRKYRLFCRKIKDVQISIWEFDFKIAKARYLRESVRRERDRAIETKIKIEEEIKKTATQEQFAKKPDLEKELTFTIELIGKYEAQMQMVDDQIEGIKPHEENPGQQGLKETIAGLAELREMYKDYLKHGI